MICSHCKKEIEKKEMTFEGLTVRPIEQIGIAFKYIKIPVGWRLPTLVEGVALVNNPDFVKWSRFDDSEHDFYIVQPFKKNEGVYAAWLGCGVDGFFIYTVSNLNNGGAARGVLLVKEKGERI